MSEIDVSRYKLQVNERVTRTGYDVSALHVWYQGTLRECATLHSVLSASGQHVSSIRGITDVEYQHAVAHSNKRNKTTTYDSKESDNSRTRTIYHVVSARLNMSELSSLSVNVSFKRIAASKVRFQSRLQYELNVAGLTLAEYCSNAERARKLNSLSRYSSVRRLEHKLPSGNWKYSFSEYRERALKTRQTENDILESVRRYHTDQIEKQTKKLERVEQSLAYRLFNKSFSQLDALELTQYKRATAQATRARQAVKELKEMYNLHEEYDEILHVSALKASVGGTLAKWKREHKEKFSYV